MFGDFSGAKIEEFPELSKCFVNFFAKIVDFLSLFRKKWLSLHPEIAKIV